MVRELRIVVLAHLAPPRHCAGAERMLLSLLRPLADRGHRVDVVLSRSSDDTEPYDLNGVTVHPRISKGDPYDYLPTADLIVAHLENAGRAVVLGRQQHIPFVLVMHNDFPTSRVWCVDDAALVVLNSRWMFDAFGRPANGIVVRPLLFGDDYQTTPGSKVTLVNTSERKGGAVFGELAARMPDVDFLAVEGAYGDQLVPDLPNVEHRAHGTDMRSVYGSTRLLLMPSAYESWGRVGTEAMQSGIPVLAHPTPGLVESLGDAGTFIDRDHLAGWEVAIRRLLKPTAWKRAARAALARAAELDTTDELDDWCEAVEQIARRKEVVA